MFYVVATIECLAVSFLVGVLTSVLCLPASRLVWTRTRQRHPGTTANILFASRLIPPVIGALVALEFALPAYLLFEPRPSDDYIGPMQLGFAAFGALILTVMVFRGAHILRSTYLVEKRWKSLSTRIDVPGIGIPTYCVEGVPSLFVATGMMRPCVFVSREIVQEFSADEMAAAAAHEMAHIRAHDNLKQLLLDICRPPVWLLRLGAADHLWLQSVELAADQAALAEGNAPLHLASALLKVARQRKSLLGQFRVAGSHLVPAESAVRLETRVNHLVELSNGETASRSRQFSRRLVYGCILASVLCFVLSYVATAHVVLRFVERALDVLF